MAGWTDGRIEVRRLRGRWETQMGRGNRIEGGELAKVGASEAVKD